jgi:hypothetical protein
MKQPQWSRVLAALCLLTLSTVAAQCSEEDQAVADIAGNIIADAAMTMESTIFPEATATPTQTPEPEPSEVGFADELNDVMDFNTKQLASSWSPGMDLSEVILRVDPASGLVEFRAFFPEIEDPQEFLASNPYFMLIIAGDGDPEGTPPVADRGFFGMGQWHIGCFPGGVALDCKLWVRDGDSFIEVGESFNANFMDGYWSFYFPEEYPPSEDYLGVVALDSFSYDILGIDGETYTITPRLTFKYDI